jgi:hypothetical protein
MHDGSRERSTAWPTFASADGMSRTRMLRALTAFVASTFVVTALPGTARPAFPGSNGKIVFASERDGDFEI